MSLLKNNDTLLTVGEVAARLRVSDESVYRLVRSGKLRSIKVGGLWRVPASALAELLHTGQQASSTITHEGKE
jgi:excisionase family DNA binding protein